MKNISETGARYKEFSTNWGGIFLYIQIAGRNFKTFGETDDLSIYYYI